MPTIVTLATATPGGGFPVFGQAFADAIHATDPSLEIQQRNTKGSTENVPLLEAGAVDIALVQGEVAHEAFNGIGRAPADLKIVAAMYSTPGMFVVRADSPYRAVHDLRGKPVAFGASGSGLVILSRYVLDGLGLDQDRDFQAIYLERAGDGPAMVIDGRAALPTLMGEATRLMVLGGLLWAGGDITLLLIDAGHDLRVARILLGRMNAELHRSGARAEQPAEPALRS